MALARMGDTGVVVISLDHPDTLNAVNVELLETLRDDLSTAVVEKATGLVLTGRGRAFCAGVDLDLVRAALAEGARPQLDPLLDILGPLVLSFRELPFPTVCALEGPAVGVGMSLALCADLRVVARSASLIPGYLRLGASLDGGLSWSLTAAVGGARAMSIVLRNERLGPDRLMALGLAEEIVDDGEAVSGALALLERLGPVAPLALTRVRSLVDSAAALPLRQQLDRERTLITELWESADYHEGVTAFLEKRAPRFAGN